MNWHFKKKKKSSLRTCSHWSNLTPLGIFFMNSLHDPKTQAYNLKALRMDNIARCLREGNPDFSRWMYHQLVLKEFLPEDCLKSLNNYKTNIKQAIVNKTRNTKTSDKIIRIKMKNNSAWSTLKWKKKKILKTWTRIGDYQIIKPVWRRTKYYFSKLKGSLVIEVKNLDRR